MTIAITRGGVRTRRQRSGPGPQTQSAFPSRNQSNLPCQMSALQASLDSAPASRTRSARATPPWLTMIDGSVKVGSHSAMRSMQHGVALAVGRHEAPFVGGALLDDGPVDGPQLRPGITLPGAEGQLSQAVVETISHRVEADRVAGDLRGLAGAPEGRDEPGHGIGHDDVAQLAPGLGGLAAADLVQRNVALPLEAAFGVPIRLAMADEHDGRDGWGRSQGRRPTPCRRR